MNREVELVLSGLHASGQEQESEAVETVQPAQYFKRNDSHYLLYEEKMDEDQAPCRSRIKFREVRFMMTFMLVFLLLNNLFIFLFDPNQGTTLYGTRTVLCHLFWRYDLTAEQLFYMINISLKYFVALPVAILFISATDPSEFAASLNSIGISYKVGYSVAIALRYIPDIQRDYHSISQAQQARGVELGKKEPFFKRMKNSVNILLPLILTSLNRIDTISNAMELRGFGKNSKRTWYTQRPFARRDFIALGVGVVLLLISLTVTIRFGRFYNPFL